MISVHVWTESEVASLKKTRRQFSNGSSLCECKHNVQFITQIPTSESIIIFIIYFLHIHCSLWARPVAVDWFILILMVNHCDNLCVHWPNGEGNWPQNCCVHRFITEVRTKNNQFRYSPIFGSTPGHLCKHIVGNFQDYSRFDMNR